MKTLRVCPDKLHHVKQESLACGIASQSRKPLGSRMMMSMRLVAVREIQSATGEELDALLPSVLDRAFPRRTMMAKVNARRKSRKDTVEEKKFPISDVAITDIPLTEALVLRRKYYYSKGPDFMTNVPHLVIFYSETGFSFGFHGKGPLDLAINVCEWYLRHIGYYGPRTQHWSGVSCQNGDCFELTFDLHVEFWRDFIERVPDEGTTIPFADLKNWFDNHV